MALRIENLLEECSRRYELRLLCGQEGLRRELDIPDINRPGLAFAGFLDYFPAGRLQVVGKTEIAFWSTLTGAVRKERVEAILALKPAGFVVSNDQIPPQELLDAAAKAGVPVIATPMPTSTFVTNITVWLEEKLAPSLILHGTLVDVFGAGVLILGESGIGKSECALALIDKGHRLCADDVVEIRRTPERLLLGQGMASLRHHMEIRGVGIIDIRSLFGTRAIRERKLVELIVMLLPASASTDRTGLEHKTHTILEVPVPMVEIPVQMGKNLAVVTEVAAMNWRLRQMGVNSAAQLDAAVQADMAARAGRLDQREGSR